MSFLDSILSLADTMRGKLNAFGLTPYRVWVRVEAWNGGRAGVGAKTVTETELVVGGGNPPEVHLVTDKQVVAPGGALMSASWKVGPLTPAYVSNGGGGVPVTTLHPAGGPGVEILYRLTGPGLPATGLLCKKTSEDLSDPFQIMLTIQGIGQAAP